MLHPTELAVLAAERRSDLERTAAVRSMRRRRSAWLPRTRRPRS